MTILICMNRRSPWARSIASTFQSWGHTVHVFDFETDRAGGYLSDQDPVQAAEIGAFDASVSGVHLRVSKGSGYQRYVFGAGAVRKIAREIRADALLTLYGGGLALMAWLSRARPYHVYTVGSDVLLVGRAGRRINRTTLGAARRVFANGQYLASQTRLQSPRADVRELLLGIETARYPLSSFPEGPVRFVCSRGFQPVYNNEAIVRALALLPQDLDWRMTFVSSGPTLENAKALAEQVLPPSAKSKVEFLGGVSTERLQTELANSHAFVSMSRSDGTATSLLEALASGLYPVLSDIPPNREWVSGTQGALVPLDNDQALADTLASLASSLERCREAAGYNRSQAMERADAQKNRRILLEALQEQTIGGRK